MTKEETERRRLHPDLLLSNRRWGLDVCGMDRRLLPLPYIEAVERVMMEMGEKMGTGAGTKLGIFTDLPQAPIEQLLAKYATEVRCWCMCSSNSTAKAPFSCFTTFSSSSDNL